MSDVPTPEVKEIATRSKKKMTPEELIDMQTRVMATALKDHDAAFAKDAVEQSNRYCRGTLGNDRVALADEPCRLTLSNPNMKDEVKQMAKGLVSDGLKLQLNGVIVETTRELPTEKPPTGLHKAVKAVRKALEDGDHTLHRGYIYSIAEGADFTYIPLDPVDVYVNKILQYEHIAKDLLGHTKAVTDLLRVNSCTIIQQMKVNYDLIEVLGGKCWKITARRFIDTPYTEDDRGHVSPRMFFPYDSNTNPQPRYFKSSVLNSFPHPTQHTRFLNKWYQLLLHQRMPQKVRKLCTWGPRDSGKTTWIEPLRAIVPLRFFGSLTKESTFGTSMIDEHTQVTFIDEFLPGVNLSNDVAKQLFQGGPFTNTKKFETGRIHLNKSPYYIVCQNEPDFGEGDLDVKRRLYIMKTRALQSTTPGIDTWLQENAMHCVVWAGQVINRNHDLVESDELFYEPGRLSLLANVATETNDDDKADHYERIGQGKRQRSIPSTRCKALFRPNTSPGPSALQTPPTSASEFDNSMDMDSPPRPMRMVVASFSPLSACCTPARIATTPTPSLSSDSDDEQSQPQTSTSGKLTKGQESPTTVDLSTIVQTVPLDSQDDPIIDENDETGILAREVFRLLQSNIGGNADRAHLLSHGQKYQKFGTKKMPKINAEFIAFCFVRGRFVGDFDPRKMYKYYKRDIVEGHVARIRNLLGL